MNVRFINTFLHKNQIVQSYIFVTNQVIQTCFFHSAESEKMLKKTKDFCFECDTHSLTIFQILALQFLQKACTYFAEFPEIRLNEPVSIVFFCLKFIKIPSVCGRKTLHNFAKKLREYVHFL